MKFQWQRDNRNSLRLVLNGHMTHYDDMISLITKSKNWCERSGIPFIDDSFFSISFTCEENLSWFLLTWC